MANHHGASPSGSGFAGSTLPLVPENEALTFPLGTISPATMTNSNSPPDGMPPPQETANSIPSQPPAAANHYLGARPAAWNYRLRAANPRPTAANPPLYPPAPLMGPPGLQPPGQVRSFQHFTFNCGTITSDPDQQKVLLLQDRTSWQFALPQMGKNPCESQEWAAIRATMVLTGVYPTLLQTSYIMRHLGPVDYGPLAVNDPVLVQLMSTPHPLQEACDNAAGINDIFHITFWYIATADSTIPLPEVTDENSMYVPRWVPYVPRLRDWVSPGIMDLISAGYFMAERTRDMIRREAAAAAASPAPAQHFGFYPSAEAAAAEAGAQQDGLYTSAAEAEAAAAAASQQGGF